MQCIITNIFENINITRQNQSTVTGISNVSNVSASWNNIHPRGEHLSTPVHINSCEPTQISNRFETLLIENNENDCNIENGNYEVNNNNNLHNGFNKNRGLATAVKRRSSVVINQHPENQHDFRKIVRPGNSSYSDVTRHGKNIKIISDSIPKGLRMYEFNRYIKSGKASIITFPGATAKRLSHYCLPTLIDDKPEVVVIHAGCNDLSTKRGEVLNRNIKEVTDDIINIGKKCMEHGAKKICISSIVRSKTRRADLACKMRKLDFRT